MKKMRNQVLVVSLILLSIVFACNQNKEKVDQPESKPETEEGQQFPEPDPVTFKGNSNLAFHEISWQYFLWLTEEVREGVLRFETLPTDKAITPETKNDTNQVLGGVQQAQSEGILVDFNGRAVYTNMMINDVYQEFVINNKLYDAETLKSFPGDTSFPVGALSLKAAWKIVGEGEDVSGFYTKNAEIQLLANVDGSVEIPKNPKTQKDVKVALVGFHIAIVVQGHPEAIWATFEHRDNAPYVVASQKMNASVSEDNFTFYREDTTMASCNQNNKPIIQLDEATQKLTPVTHVARQYRLGDGNSVNQNNIDRLNDKMHAMLNESSLWKNYYEVGAIWFNKDNALRPDWTPNTDASLITGSTKLSNAVIETFTQNIKSQNNCFSCHNTMSVTTVPMQLEILSGKNVLTSHILLQHYLDGTKVKRQ